VVEALKKYRKIALECDKKMGIHVINPNYNDVLIKKNEGYNFIAFSSDIIFLADTIKNNMSNLK
jgi:2-dehydro-3-deoxyglucarate aldolase